MLPSVHSRPYSALSQATPFSKACQLITSDLITSYNWSETVGTSIRAGSSPISGAAIARIRSAVLSPSAMFVVCPGPKSPLRTKVSGDARINPACIPRGQTSPSLMTIIPNAPIAATRISEVLEVSPSWNSTQSLSPSPHDSLEISGKNGSNLNGV